MIDGHGDDAYHYEGTTIRADFSSNIAPAPSLSPLLQHLAACERLLTHYPEPEAWSLEAAIAHHHHVSPDCVVATSGATDAIYLLAQAFPMERELLRPTFSEYDDAFRLFPATQHQQLAYWICTPNNPNGLVLSPDALRNYARHCHLLVADQSYAAYTRQPMMSAQEAVELGNVVQIRSMTKDYGVPGLRLGYLVAHPRLAAQVRRCLRPWAVSALAVEAGKYLLAHHAAMQVRPDHDEAARLFCRLAAIPQLFCHATHTTFMLCQLQSPLTAAQLKDYLVRRHGLLIRDASNFAGLPPTSFRVAAQTAEENDALVRAIQDFLTRHD